jgi:DNA-binding CsgD family transcriptional regulator
MPPNGTFSADILTNTESSVLSLIGQGKTSKEIAAALKISVLTVGNHRRNICKKLNFHSTAELASFGSAYTGGQKTDIPLGTACRLKLCLKTGDGRITVVYNGALARHARVASVAIGAIIFNF